MDKCVERSNYIFCSIFMSTVYFKNTLYKPFSASKGKEGEHGLINYINNKAKCCNLKNLTVKGLCGRCYLSDDPPPPYDPIPPLHIVYVYMYLRESYGATVHKAGSKIPT
jgi:hypothetical protein